MGARDGWVFWSGRHVCDRQEAQVEAQHSGRVLYLRVSTQQSFLLLPTLVPRAGNFTAWERMMARYFGAGAMYVIGKKLKKKHGIADERADLYKAADEWVAALGDRKFLGGKTPNLADLAVFGVLRPIRHLTAGRDMVANSSIGPWYERMEEHVGASARITAVEGAAVGKITAADGASADGATGVGAAGKIAAADGAAANGAAMGNVAAGGAAAGGVPAGGATAHGAAVSQGHGAAAEQ
ncbi:unnamed protein product [Closterium sp. NIES-53]